MAPARRNFSVALEPVRTDWSKRVTLLNYAVLECTACG
jgi:hypothetical protein